MSDHLWQFGNRKNIVSSVEGNLEYYKCLLKHALLFHKRVVLADHMIVNSPNFLRCLLDGTIDDLLATHALVAAHIEPVRDYHEANKNTRTFSGLRAFYRHYQYFDEALPDPLRGQDVDASLTRIEPSFGKIYAENPDPYAREKRLASFFHSFVESAAFAKTFADGSEPSTVDAGRAEVRLAVGKIQERYGPVGIIHLDPSQADPNEETIFDVIRKIPGVKTDVGHPVHFGDWERRLARVSRTLLFKAEIGDLSVAPILTPMEHEHVDLFTEVLSSTQPGDGERYVDVPIRCACLKREGLAVLSGPDIASIRESPQATRFFSLCDDLASAELFDAAGLKDALASYCSFIDRFVFDKYNSIRPTNTIEV